MPDDGWRQMLCVEAASIDTPVLLAPGQQWSISQTLSLG
jgi:glucose-6-phosphate 1-epimerase